MKSTQYKKEQLKLRLMQMFYGSGIFSLPFLYKLKNRAYSSAFHTGKDFRIGSHCWIYRTHGCKEGKIHIGDYVRLSDNIIIDYSGEVEMCSYASIAEGVRIFSHKHNRVAIMRDYLVNDNVIRVKTSIGEHVMIGDGAIIMPGVTIGKDATIYPGAVVIRDVEEGATVLGNPAESIKDVIPRMKKKKKVRTSA